MRSFHQQLRLTFEVFLRLLGICWLFKLTLEAWSSSRGGIPGEAVTLPPEFVPKMQALCSPALSSRLSTAARKTSTTRFLGDASVHSL